MNIKHIVFLFLIHLLLSDRLHSLNRLLPFFNIPSTTNQSTKAPSVASDFEDIQTPRQTHSLTPFFDAIQAAAESEFTDERAYIHTYGRIIFKQLLLLLYLDVYICYDDWESSWIFHLQTDDELVPHATLFYVLNLMHSLLCTTVVPKNEKTSASLFYSTSICMGILNLFSFLPPHIVASTQPSARLTSIPQHTRNLIGNITKEEQHACSIAGDFITIQPKHRQTKFEEIIREHPAILELVLITNTKLIHSQLEIFGSRGTSLTQLQQRKDFTALRAKYNSLLPIVEQALLLLDSAVPKTGFLTNQSFCSLYQALDPLFT